MVLQRYLFRISYVGTHFSGVQKQKTIQKYANGGTVVTVLDQIEACLSQLITSQPVKVVCSSRTDAGVHALSNSVHVDLDCPSIGGIYDPAHLSKVLNRYFQQEKSELRVREVLPVSQCFHCRHDASLRTYLYRLGVYKGELGDPDRSIGTVFPIAEWNRAHLVSEPFDLERFKEAAQAFRGRHDFRSFASTRLDEGIDTVRTINDISVTAGRPLFDPAWDSKYEDLDFFDVSIKSKGFLRNQVRRIVGALLGVAKGKLTPERIRCMLENPGVTSWDKTVEVAPACGLYLVNVDYPPEVLERNYISPYMLQKAEREKLELEKVAQKLPVSSVPCEGDAVADDSEKIAVQVN